MFLANRDIGGRIQVMPVPVIGMPPLRKAYSSKLRATSPSRCLWFRQMAICAYPQARWINDTERAEKMADSGRFGWATGCANGRNPR